VRYAGENIGAMLYISLSDDELIRTFEGESQRKGSGEVDPMLCLEIMQRAFVRKITAVFETVERYYGKLFLYWVWKDPAFRSLAERWGDGLADDVLQEAYANIFRSLRKFVDPTAFYDKFDHICRKFLGFMRMCIHSSIQDVLRNDLTSDVKPAVDSDADGAPLRRSANVPISIDAVPDVIGVEDDTGPLQFMEVLNYIRSLLSRKQWLLFYCAYVYDMRPREIADLSELSMTAHEVSAALYTIRQRLKDEPRVRDMLS
jgi:DNA-directed RNA polymerase specialized sigma24 family protein